MCRRTNWLFLKMEPLSGTARFGRCRISKCPFHMSINRPCAAHLEQSTLQTGFKLYISYVTAEPSTSAMLSFTHTIQKVQLSCNTFNRSVDSCNKALFWRYRLTTYHALDTTSLNIVERCYSRSGDYSVHGTGPPLPIHRFGYVTLRSQIVTPVHSQTSKLYNTQTVRFQIGVPPWTMISLPSCAA